MRNFIMVLPAILMAALTGAIAYAFSASGLIENFAECMAVAVVITAALIADAVMVSAIAISINITISGMLMLPSEKMMNKEEG